MVQRMLTYTTFVVGPTRTSYTGADPTDLASELNELTTMVDKDIKFLTSQGTGVCPNVLYTGHPDSQTFSGYLDAMSQSDPETLKKIVFSAHGSPGRNGKIGMGYDEVGKPDYRVTPSDLVEILKSLDIKRLRTHKLHFYFSCCNSAYATLDGFKRNENETKKAIYAQSLIGGFYDRMDTLRFTRFSVTGYRGYYFPGINKAELATKDVKRPVADGTVTINTNGAVEYSQNIWGLKNDSELDKKL